MALGRYELTERQEYIRSQREDFTKGGQLRRPGDKPRPFSEIAAELDITCSSVRTQYRYAMDKIAAKRQTPGSTKMIKNTEAPITGADDPELVAGAMAALTDPEERLKNAIKELGLPVKAAEAMVRRLKARYMPAVDEVKAYRTKEMIDAMRGKITLALQFMNPQALAEATGRDLAMIVGILVEKMQLLKGEPTQIISNSERKQMDQLVPALLKEAARRGIALPAAVVGQTLEHQAPERKQ